MGLISASILAYRIKQAKANIKAYSVQLEQAENKCANYPTLRNEKTRRYYEVIVQEYEDRLAKLEKQLEEIKAKETR